MISISPTAIIHKLSDIEDSVRGTKITINNGAVIDAFVKIKPVGGAGDIVIESNSIINSGCVLYSGNGIHIGKDCAIAANCTFAPVNHAYEDKNTPIRKQGFKASKGGIIIGDDVWIGANCVILDGTVVGDGCVIGASTLVKGNLDAYGIYAGNPMKRISERI
ncbi:MAG: acyltransferase [Gammaproteobacteria bacterium]|nr:acyltransferase [Gammaproteobacteria bacterium]MCK5091595.1 acyltransferase [Gammaproteobacteria bacterium]